MSYIHNPIKWVKKCERCGLKNPVENTLCHHCSHLDKNKLALLKVSIKKQKKLNRNLGKYFIFATIILIIFMAI
jgi:rRNA maturation endonuclease Nob1